MGFSLERGRFFIKASRYPISYHAFKCIRSSVSMFFCLGKASANIAILSLSPDSSTSATSFLNAAMFFANGAMTLAIFSCPRTTTNSNCRKWSLVGALNAALIIRFKASSLTSRPNAALIIRFKASSLTSRPEKSRMIAPSAVRLLIFRLQDY